MDYTPLQQDEITRAAQYLLRLLYHREFELLLGIGQDEIQGKSWTGCCPTTPTPPPTSSVTPITNLLCYPTTNLLCYPHHQPPLLPPSPTSSVTPPPTTNLLCYPHHQPPLLPPPPTSSDTPTTNLLCYPHHQPPPIPPPPTSSVTHPTTTLLCYPCRHLLGPTATDSDVERNIASCQFLVLSLPYLVSCH